MEEHFFDGKVTVKDALRLFRLSTLGKDFDSMDDTSDDFDPMAEMLLKRTRSAQILGDLQRVEEMGRPARIKPSWEILVVPTESKTMAGRAARCEVV